MPSTTASVACAVQAPSAATIKRKPGVGRFVTGTVPGQEPSLHSLGRRRGWCSRHEEALAGRQRPGPPGS
eukprot:11189298-Lingulodinium_polyedra.AAC.1